MNKIEKLFWDELNQTLEKDCIYIQNEKCEIEYEFFDFNDHREELYYLSFRNKTFYINYDAQPDNNYFNGYIPDFAIYINGLKKGFVIEIDGHEWHEKTKEQARADKEKDRAYLKNGFIPIRFTGSEVFHNVKRCISDMFEIILNNNDFFEYEMLSEENDTNKNFIKYQSEQIEGYEKDINSILFGYKTSQAILIKDNTIKLRWNVLDCQ